MRLHLACRLTSTSDAGSDPNTPVRRSAHDQPRLTGNGRLHPVYAVQVAHGVLRKPTTPPGDQGADYWRLEAYGGS